MGSSSSDVDKNVVMLRHTHIYPNRWTRKRQRSMAPPLLAAALHGCRLAAWQNGSADSQVLSPDVVLARHQACQNFLFGASLLVATRRFHDVRL
jgi:hypothetical protein